MNVSDVDTTLILHVGNFTAVSDIAAVSNSTAVSNVTDINI